MTRIVVGTKNISRKGGTREVIDLNNYTLVEDVAKVLDEEDLKELGISHEKVDAKK